MAPLGRFASVALGVACCVAFTGSAFADDDAPVFLAGVGAPQEDSTNVLAPSNGEVAADSSADSTPVFLAGVGAPQEDSPAVLLSSSSGAGAPTAASDDDSAPVFLAGVAAPAEDTPAVLLNSGDYASTTGTDGSGDDAPVFLAGVAAPEDDSLAILKADGSASSAPTPAPSSATNAGSGAVLGGPTLVLGGWPTMPVGDAEINFLVNVIGDQKYYNPALSFGVCMKDIFKLQYQSVSGTNFRYSGHGCLVQRGSTAMGACSADCAVEQLQITIYTQEWTNTIQVTDIARIQQAA